MQLNLHGDKDAGILIRELTNKINKLDITVQAFYELMKEKGITQEQLNAKIDEIISREVKGEYGNRKKLCPKCGKVVQESNSTPMRGSCVFCGTVVMFYPYEPKEELESAPKDPLDDLGF